MSAHRPLPERLGGRYRLLHPIARGGMGQVYEGLDETLGRRVAIKVLLPELAQDPTCRERFRREAHAVAATSHPSLVAIYDLKLDDEPAWMVMELLEGTSLSALLAEEGRLPWPRAVRLMIQVLDAVQCLHDAGVVHRDLKPANVLVVGHGERELAKVIDLGVAQLVTGQAYQRLTASGAVVGTPAFMAPEQLGGERVGPAADLWAVGTILFTCLAGARPFAARDLSSLLESMHGSAPPSLRAVAPDVPEPLERIVRSLLEKFPEDRPSSARAAADALRALGAPPASASPVVGTPRAAPLPPQRDALRAAPTLPGAEPVSLPSVPRVSMGPLGRRTQWAVLAAVALAGLAVIASCGLGAALYLFRTEDTAWDHLPPPTSIVTHYSGATPLTPTAPELDARMASCLDLSSRTVGGNVAQLRVDRDPTGLPTRVYRVDVWASEDELQCLERELMAARYTPGIHPPFAFAFIVAAQ